MRAASLTWFLLALLGVARLCAETGEAAWLRYQPVDSRARADLYARLPSTVVTLDDSSVVNSARDEIIKAVRGMLARTLRAENHKALEDSIVLGTLPAIKKDFPQAAAPPALAADGYWLGTTVRDGRHLLFVAGQSERGV